MNLWADTARPRFVEIVGPYKKWGGDNADAFYCYAPIDPTRTYRVTLAPGRRRLHVPDRLRGPRRRPVLRAIVGSVNSHERERAPTARSTSSCRRTSRREPDVAWIRLEPDAVAAITRDYLRTRPGGAPPGTSRPTTRPTPSARTTRIWPAASGP